MLFVGYETTVSVLTWLCLELSRHPQVLAISCKEQKPLNLIRFGAGARICVGIAFAKLEMKIIASYFIAKLPMESFTILKSRTFSYSNPTKPLDAILALKIFFVAGEITVTDNKYNAARESLTY